VQLQLRTLGGEVVGLIALLVSTIGLASVIEEAIENSMVRELGTAHHSGDRARFAVVYNSALAVSTLAAGCVALVYTIILLVLPLLDVPLELLSAARWFIVAKMLESAIIVALAPANNMYLATERMIGFNGWLVARRASAVVAIVLTLLSKPESPAQGLILYGWLSVGLHALVIVAAVGSLAWRDRRLIPRPSCTDRGTMRTIARTSSANASMFIAGLLELPAGALIMNLAFGLHGNLIFGLGAQAAGYVRMVAAGPITGIDAVATRLSTAADPAQRLRALVYHTTRLQTFVVIPSAVAMFILAPTFMRVWVGGTGVSDQVIGDAVTLSRIMILGFVAKCMLDVWWRLLYGAGHVRPYVRLVVTAAISTPILGLLLLWLLPASIRYWAPALAFAVAHATAHLGVLPHIITARFQMPYRSLIAAMARPLIPAAGAGAAMVLVESLFDAPTITSIIAQALAFGVVYLLVGSVVAFEQGDRARVFAIVRHARNMVLGAGGDASGAR